MNENDIYEWCVLQETNNNILKIPEYFYDSLSKENADFIKNYFPQTTLFHLPPNEINFFEWLKINDTAVWNDLWTDEINEPYIVSLLFLPVLINNGYRGFPICDLLNNENYYFAPQHLADKESELFVESSKTIFMNKQPMTIPQLLAVEISLQAIDIWHFAYKHKLSVADCKKAVQDLVNDEILVHLKDAEYLTTFINF